MGIRDMHIWFRQYAQQMGMQNVRAILPEQIDLLINTSIIDTVNQIITQNIGITNDRVITDNSKIGQINALKTLYKVKKINIFEYSYSSFKETNVIATSTTFDETETFPINDLGTQGFVIRVADSVSSERELISVTIDTSSTNSTYDIENHSIVLGTSGASTLSARISRLNTIYQSYFNEAKIINPYTPELYFEYYSESSRTGDITGVKIRGKIKGELSIISATTDIEVDYLIGYTISSDFMRFNVIRDNISKNVLISYGLDIDWLYLVDFSIDYKKGAGGMTITGPASYQTNGFVSKYFPVRLIDDAYLADTLNDYILAPRFRSPIITINNSEIQLYFDDFIKKGDNSYVLQYDLVPYTLRVSYISKPAKVAYRVDAGEGNTDCDLPEYLHIDILKHAVDLYRASISGNMLAQQAQDQNQQREIARNQAVPSDGYQRNQ